MSNKDQGLAHSAIQRLKSGFTQVVNDTETLEFQPHGLGQRYPQDYPQGSNGEVWHDELGEPMTIRDVALLLGCSVWTVRQRHLPYGLPYFRLGTTGKLVFYRKQVVAWILANQQKGGNIL